MAVDITKHFNPPRICTSPNVTCCDYMFYYEGRFKCYACNSIVLNLIHQSNSKALESNSANFNAFRR